MTRKKIKAWLVRDKGGSQVYGLSIAERSEFNCLNGVWGLSNGGTDGWLLAPDSAFCARTLRRHFHYAGPLPKPGKCMRVTVEVPDNG